MRVSNLRDRLRSSGLLTSSLDGADVDVETVSMDSERLERNALFCCVPGSHRDGHDFVARAAQRGAVAFICERPVDVASPQLIVSSVRKAMAIASAAVYGEPATNMKVVGITGTNGKTTTAALLESIFVAADLAPLVIGTLSGVRTTPEAPELHARLAAGLVQGKKSAVMEVSSHALVQHRVDAIGFDLSVFTNLSQDHLDYHGNMENYFAAKSQLFTPERTDIGVVNADDDYGKRIIERGGLDLHQFRFADAENLQITATGCQFTWQGVPMHTKLSARFNVMNALAAIKVSSLMGIDLDTVATGLAALPGVPGRFEIVPAAHGATIIVDYAHTPDGLQKLLDDARHLVAPGHRLILVFGCGGNRDTGKRAHMGAAAERGADSVYVTSDNPRSEDPAGIVGEILKGMQEPGRAEVVLDRRSAIESALAEAREGDVMIVAGKGHERYQEIEGTLLEFHDPTVITEVAKAMADA